MPTVAVRKGSGSRRPTITTNHSSSASSSIPLTPLTPTANPLRDGSGSAAPILGAPIAVESPALVTEEPDEISRTSKESVRSRQNPGVLQQDEPPRTSVDQRRRRVSIAEPEGQAMGRNSREFSRVAVDGMDGSGEGRRQRSRTIAALVGPSIEEGVVAAQHDTSSRRGSRVADEGTTTVGIRLSSQEDRQIQRIESGRGSARNSTDRARPVDSPGTRERSGTVGWFQRAVDAVGLGSDPDPYNDPIPSPMSGISGTERRGSQSWGEGGVDLEKGRGERVAKEEEEELHHDRIVNALDCVDPQVKTVTDLQDMANSIMVPPIPALWRRKPTIALPSPETSAASSATRPRAGTRSQTSRTLPTTAAGEPPSAVPDPPSPLGEKTATDHEEDHLDAHIRSVLDGKKRSPKKELLIRTAKGTWAFVKTPIGCFTAIYGFLCAFWGAAIVLFLLGWIDTGSAYNKKLWIEISSQIENGLFTITGIGLVPWRTRDCYRISAIWLLQRKDRKLRIKRGLPVLEDRNEAPDPDLTPDFVQVLSDHEQGRLKYQQRAFGKSQTWYRPHETETHKPFSIRWALAICFFMIGNSAFQAMLCGTMWGLNRFNRPPWTTGCLIPLSFGCGIAAAILIWKGSARFRKQKEVEQKLRDALDMDGESVDSHEEAASDNGKARATESSAEPNAMPKEKVDRVENA